MNTMTLNFTANLENEAFARTCAIAFLMPLNPNLDEVMEIKTIIAEAVVNAMIHGYENNPAGIISLHMEYNDALEVKIVIQDEGCGIEDIDQAMQPLYTSKEHLERSGMGLTIMSTFSDEFKIVSSLNKGTCITIVKKLSEHDGHNR
ncbi:MAG: anti-sigma F factor [Erysipelotrichaceae bacterium]